MQVHHVAPHFYPETGGAESALLRLCEFLVERGHEVVVHTSSRTYQRGRLPERGTFGKIEIRRYRPVFRLGYYATLLRPRIEGADVVHLHGYAFLANDWTARKMRGRVPLVYSLYHGVAQRPPSAFARAKRALYDPLFGLKTLSRVDAILPLSDVDRVWLEARGFPASKIRVIPTGLDSFAFQAGSPERARERVGLRRYVLYLGRLHREKSVDHLIKAIASLPQRDVSLALVGPDAGAKPDLVDLAAASGLGERVRFLGEVDEPTKRDLLAGCECLVLPSFYESQGIVILEAWAQGRPVVASSVGGVPFLVTDGTDGFLYWWGDVPALTRHIEALLTAPARAAAMGRAGREKARTQYAWDRLAPRFEEVYAEVVGRRPSQGSRGP